eukprot:s5372_g1.t1
MATQRMVIDLDDDEIEDSDFPKDLPVLPAAPPAAPPQPDITPEPRRRVPSSQLTPPKPKQPRVPEVSEPASSSSSKRLRTQVEDFPDRVWQRSARVAVPEELQAGTASLALLLVSLDDRLLFPPFGFEEGCSESPDALRSCRNVARSQGSVPVVDLHGAGAPAWLVFSHLAMRSSFEVEDLLPDGAAGAAAMSREGQTSAMTTQQLLVVCGLALLTRFFTNLEAIPGMSTLSMACCCVLAEAVGSLWLFLLSLVGVGIMQGLSTWGYLQADALLICVLLQIPLSIAYLTHRRLVKLHPESAVVTLAFPCINTALWILSFFFLPIGSIASPAYDLAGQALILTQCAAWFGRSGVTFVLSWLAAAGAHRFTHPSAVRGWRAALFTLFSLCLAGGFRYYAPTTFMGMQFEPPGGEPQDYYRVSCISMMRDMYGETQKRLEAGDTIVMHSEVSTPAHGGSPVSKYQAGHHGFAVHG